MEPIEWIRSVHARVKQRITSRVDWQISERAPDPEGLVGLNINFDSERVKDVTLLGSAYWSEIRCSSIVDGDDAAARSAIAD